MAVYMVLIDRELEAMQYGIETDASFQSSIGFFFKFLKQLLLIEVVKSVYYFIGKANKTVNIVNGLPQILMQQSDSTAKRSAVSLRGYSAADFAYLVKQLHHT